MLTFTDAARERVLGFMQDFYTDDVALRIGVRPESSALAPQYDLALVEADEADPEDTVVDAGEFRVLVDARTLAGLEGAVVDFGRAGFEVRSPAGEAAPPGGELAERVARVIEQRINPAVAAHGGRIALAGVDANVAYIRMSGGCQGCGLAAVTLRQGVERMLREQIPEILAVRDVTDHADGRNPFYAAK